MKSKFNPNREDKPCPGDVKKYAKNFDDIFRKGKKKDRTFNITIRLRK